MLDKWVVDIETSNSFADVGGKQNIHLLKISLIGVYSYGRGEYLAFEEKDFPLFEKELKKTGAFIGFALNIFDIPVLRSHFKDFPKIFSFDILDEVERQRGHRISLDDLAQANIGTGKNGSGLEAIDLYREGKIEELKKYCLNDVKITKELYEKAESQGHLIVPSRYSTPGKISLTWPIDEMLKMEEEKRKSQPEQATLW